jgi:hypothetical protein
MLLFGYGVKHFVLKIVFQERKKTGTGNTEHDNWDRKH